MPAGYPILRDSCQLQFLSLVILCNKQPINLPYKKLKISAWQPIICWFSHLNFRMTYNRFAKSDEPL